MMNLVLVPKYRKYNNQQHAIYITTVAPFKSPQPPKRMPNKGHIRIKDSITSWYSTKKHNIFEEEPKKKNRKKECKLCKWFEKKKALIDLEKDHLKEKQQLANWEKWKKKEQKLIEKAQREKAQEELEREYAQQFYDIHKEKERLARDTLKTKFPYKVQNKKTAANIPLSYTEPSVTSTKRGKKSSSNTAYKFKKKKQTSSDVYDYYQHLYDDVDTKPKEKEYDYYSSLNESTDTKEYDFYKNLYDHTDEVPCSTKKCKAKKQKGKKAKKPKKSKKTKTKDYYDDYYSSSKTMKTAERPSLTCGQKFVNCFYRTCCEFFCCLSLFLIVGFTIIIVS